MDTKIMRCKACNKNVKMDGFDCKGCLGHFCDAHKFTWTHECGNTSIGLELHKEKLRATNPVVKADKIIRI